MYRSFLRFITQLGSFTLFVGSVLRCTRRSIDCNRALFLGQLSHVGLRSLPTVLFSGFFVGAILVIQLHLMLAQYDANSILGGLNTSACIREVGPLIISFLLAGKVGAYTTAELGTMKVTEQIDAIRCLGTDPLSYLVAPRFLAIVICSLLLLVFGLFVGVCGSMAVAAVFYGINPLQYLQSVPRFAGGWTVFCGMFKSGVYGLIVATVSTHKGYHASGGAKGVGVAVTECAIYTNLLIVLANSFTSLILDSIHDLYRGAFSIYG